VTVHDVIRGLESRGAALRLREDGGIGIRPKGVATPTELEVLTTMREEAAAILRGRPFGAAWDKVSLYELDKVLEVAVPWSDVRLVIAPGCRVAAELRGQDPKPGCVWCTCEVLDLLLSGVGPEDARAIAGARLIFDAPLAGLRKSEEGAA
jgi:hypothetical protein